MPALYVECRIAMHPSQFFKCLADDTRLRSLLLIDQEGELCVCELMQALAESQPKISRHLAQLRDAGLLQDRRQGQWVYYRIHADLPLWQQQVINQARHHNSAYLKPCLDALLVMGNRPQRNNQCC